MRNFIIICLSLLCFTSFGQNKKANKILEEGKLLFKLEKANWHASDDYLVSFPQQLESVGGYVSYADSNDEIHTIFFDTLNPDYILVHYNFGQIPQEKPKKVEAKIREAMDFEKDLIQLYLDTRSRIMSNSDEFFSFYPNTSFNIIPIINGRQKQVFVLTAPNQSGVLILGNDYLMEYNNRNNLRKKSQIHKGILHYPTTSGSKSRVIQTTYHSHVLSDLITSTDICTLLLYRDHVEWKQHVVVSDKYVSIFDMINETLTTMKPKEWQKIQENQ